jgi:hypothetical protein
MNAIWCLSFCHCEICPHITDAKTRRFNALRQDRNRRVRL